MWYLFYKINFFWRYQSSILRWHFSSCLGTNLLHFLHDGTMFFTHLPWSYQMNARTMHELCPTMMVGQQNLLLGIRYPRVGAAKKRTYPFWVYVINSHHLTWEKHNTVCDHLRALCSKKYVLRKHSSGQECII